MREVSTGSELAYLTIAEVARLLHRKPWPIFQAIEAGELRAFQPGGEGAWLIRSDDLDAWVAATVNTPRRTSGGTLSERLARAAGRA